MMMMTLTPIMMVMILTHQYKLYGLAGILVIGGSPSPQSVEFWSAVDPEQGSCVLTDYPREMITDSTVNLVSGRLVACCDDTCEIYREGSWRHLQDTKEWREFHSTATTEDAVLLIGGTDSEYNDIFSTEWIPMDGSAARPGPFTVRQGHSLCTIQISHDIIVVTGGHWTGDLVTQYHLFGGPETPLTPLGQYRFGHGCAVYQDAEDRQVSFALSSFKSSLQLTTFILPYYCECSGPSGYRGAGF